MKFLATLLVSLCIQNPEYVNHNFDRVFVWLQVAVKTLKESAADKEKRDLQHELAVMKMLDPHPNVVRLLGCCTEKDPIFVILEFVSGGTLQVCVILMKIGIA